MNQQYSEAELQKLTDEELEELEDRLLLEHETSSSWSIRMSSGRFATGMLGLMIWGALFLVLSHFFANIRSDARGLLQMVFLAVSAIAGAAISSLLWGRIGMNGRFLVRNSLHYWPVTLSLIVYVLMHVR